MKGFKKLLTVLSLIFVTVSCSVSNPTAFIHKRHLSIDTVMEETAFEENPVLKAAKENTGVSVLLLENGLRDEYGIVSHADNVNGLATNNFRFNTDGYIIKAGSYEILVDCGLGLSKTKSDAYLLCSPVACSQLINIMKYLLDDENDTWDAIIFTHPHSDHLTGATQLLGEMANHLSGLTIDKVYDFALPNGEYPEVARDTEIYQGYRTAMKLLEDKHVSVPKYFYNEKDEEREGIKKATIINDTINDKSFTFSFLKNPDYNKAINNPNYVSVSFLIGYGKQKMLFTGDLERDGELFLKEYYGEEIENITLYKASHHGSASSSEESDRANSREFIDHIRPEYVMVPAVAGSVEHNQNDQETTFPAYAAIERYFKYTDYIYIPSSAINNEDDVFSDYASLYGDIGFLLNGVNTVRVKTTNLSNYDKTPTTPIYNTKWFRQNRDLYFTYHTLVEEKGTSNYSNCSLFKFGHYDVVIDCGSRNSNGAELIEKLEKFVVDRKIEYLIVSHGNYSAISGLVALKEDGLLKKFLIGKLIDFGDDSNIPEDDERAPNYKQYKAIARSMGDKYVPLNDTKVEYDIASIKKYSDYGVNKFVEDGEGTYKTENIKLTVVDPINGKASDEFNNSISTIITYENKKIVNIGGLDDTKALTEEYKNLIKDATVYRCSNSPTDYANSQEFLDVLKPKYAVITPALNNDDIHYCADSKDFDRIRRANSGQVQVFPCMYVGKKTNQLLCGCTSFKLYFDKGDALVYSTSDLSLLDPACYTTKDDEHGEGHVLKSSTSSTTKQAYSN